MPRPTLFHVLLMERRWDRWSTFCLCFEQVACGLAEEVNAPRLAAITVPRRSFDRWAKGDWQGVPRPDTALILERLFGVPSEDLFSPVPEAILPKAPPRDRDGLTASLTIAENWSMSRLFLPSGEVPVARPVSVELIEATLGNEGSPLDKVAARLDGLVADFGAGHVPQAWAQQLGDLAARIPVVLTSRTSAGSVLARAYNTGPGSEADLPGCCLINGGRLEPRKARLLLLTLLRCGADNASIQAAFAAYRLDD